MTPTIEEVKKVAWNLRKSLPFGAPRDEVTLTDQQLQAFAQHYMEEGAPKWVLVADKLPEDETPVLAQFHDDTVRIAEIRWDKPGFEDTYQAYQYWDAPEYDGQAWDWSDIVSWMPLQASNNTGE